jgi:proline iminopeptidase
MDISAPTRTELYPEIEPFATGRLAVDGLHTLYFEQSGHAQGMPVVVLHGGPGAGSSPSHRRFFDPAFYRIIVFDQRGAGRSTPHGELRDNTTQHLIADLEALRRQLGIERWLLFGGSWGSTLALAYAQTHPLRCLGLVLRGIFLCRRHEIDWFLYGMRTIFPEDWRALAEHIPAAERKDLLDAYWRRLDDPDSAVRVAAARAWSEYEGACSTLLPNADAVAYFASDRVALGLARIEAHYFRHQGFLDDGELLAHLEPLRSLPGVIVQGRYDMVCPIATADELHRAWPEAQYIVVPDAGHSGWEPGIRAALVSATERLKPVLAQA